MSKQIYRLTVPGQSKPWEFYFCAAPEQAAIWRADGLDVREVPLTPPSVARWLGLSRLYRAWRVLRWIGSALR